MFGVRDMSTKVLYLPGDGLPPNNEISVGRDDIIDGLERVYTRKNHEEHYIDQAVKVGRAAMFLLGRRLYARYSISGQVMPPLRERNPRVAHQVSLHNSSVSGEPSRVSVVANSCLDRRVLQNHAISMPQDPESGQEFRKHKSGLFVMHDTRRDFADDEPERYVRGLRLGAGILLEVLQNIEYDPGFEVPEVTELEP